MLQSLSRDNKILLAALLFSCFKSYLQNVYEEDQHKERSHRALLRRQKKRMSWIEINKKTSDIHFRRMFRMDRNTFNQLCHRIISAVGEPEFKSGNYISLFLNDEDIIFNKEVSMFKAHQKTSGGFIPG